MNTCWKSAILSTGCSFAQRGDYMAESAGIAKSTTAGIGLVSVNELHSQSASPTTN